MDSASDVDMNDAPRGIEYQASDNDEHVADTLRNNRVPYQPIAHRDQTGALVGYTETSTNAEKERADLIMAERSNQMLNIASLSVGGHQPYSFRDVPNSHPVHYTGILVDKRTLGHAGHRMHGRYSPVCELYLSPIPPERLPSSWSIAMPVDEQAFSLAVKSYNLFLPFDRLIAPRSSLSLMHTDISDKAFQLSWLFMNKAICTGKIGTRSADLATTHYFRHPVTGKVMPKMEVFCEPIVRSLGQKFTQYLERHHGGLRKIMLKKKEERTPEEERLLETELPLASSSVTFRSELLAKDNVIGVRFWILVYDPRLDLGRALQRRVWRNAVGCGDASALAICQRQLQMEEKWRERVNNVVKQRQEGKNVDLPDDENGPVETDQQGANARDLEQEREEEAVLNGGMGEAEPADSRDISGGAGGGGGDKASDPQKEAQQREREERKKQRQREKATAALSNSLGLKSARGDARDPATVTQVYLQKVRAQRMEEFPHLYASVTSRAGGAGGAGGAPGGIRRGAPAERIGSDERQALVGYAKEKHVAKVSITNINALVNVVYRQLLNLPRVTVGAPEHSSYWEFNNALPMADDEAIDLGSFEHPLHPSKWFNFSRVNELWKLADHAAPEQLEIDNYMRPSDNPLARSASGKDGASQNKLDYELQFPAPSCVWRLESREGFKSKVMNSFLPPWSFFPLQEKIEEVNRMADREDDEARAQANGTSGLSSLITPEEEEFNRVERAHYEQMLNSKTWRDVLKWSKKYDEDENRKVGIKASNATDSLMLAMGHESAAQKAARAAHEVEIVDRITEVIGSSKTLRAMVDTVAEKRPTEERILRRYLRDHNFEHAFKPQMRPQTAGVIGGKSESAQSDMHTLHVAYMSEGGPSNPSLYIPINGFQNLTYRGSIIAEMNWQLKVIAGVTNSIHVLWAMMANGNPNAYLGSRRIGLHMMKVGPPGIGKSWIDEVFKQIKVKGTAVEVVHSTNMSKFVEQATPDRNIIEDEASSKVVGDTAKASSSQDHTALTLHKAWLSSDYLTFTSFEMVNNRRVQVRKRVLARGNHYTNANIQHVVKDTSIYDRYLIFVVVPYFNATSAQMEILTKELQPSRKSQSSEWINRMQLLDRLQFGLAKMIDLGAADVCIVPFVMHLLNGIPLIRRYGISNDPSLRRIPQGLELATTATMTTALLETFAGSYCCTQRQPIGSSSHDTHRERAWREDFMKEVRYRLFCTEDVSIYVLSQFYRQFIGDYNAWDTCHWIARVLCGYTESYFKDLFDREAWELKTKTIIDHETGEEVTLQKRCQRFPFTDLELYVNENSNRKMKRVYDEETDTDKLVPDIDQFVIDALLNKERWEVRGYEQRGRVKGRRNANSTDPNIASFPFFVCHREEVERGGSANEHQENIMNFIANRGHAQAGNHTVAQPSASEVAATKARQAQRGGAGAGGAAQHQAKAPSKQRIDPNMLLVACGFTNAVKRAVSELSHAAFKHQAVDEYALQHLMQKRCVVVPVLEEIEDISQPLTFKKTINAKNEEIIVTRTVPLMEFMDFPHELIDPYTGHTIKAGRHLVINTMAIRCFDVYLGLFEFLTALEHKHSIELEAPLDLTIPGFEGVMYTHKTKPNNVRLRKSMGSRTSLAVIRTLYAERTRRLPAAFLAERNSNKDNDPATGKATLRVTSAQEYSRALEENDRKIDETFASIFDDPDVKESREVFDEDRQWADAVRIDSKPIDPSLKRTRIAPIDAALGINKDKQSTSSSGADRNAPSERIAPARIPAPRKHLPPSFRQEAAIASIENAYTDAEKFYERYHIFEEYEKWMYEENGKEITKNVYEDKAMRVKHISEKKCYPHNIDARIEEQVAHGANYSITRMHFKGQRVNYPAEVIADAIAAESKDERRHRKNPASYLNIPAARCQAHKEFVLRSLQTYREFIENRKQQVPKVARTEQELLDEAAAMGEDGLGEGAGAAEGQPQQPALPESTQRSQQQHQQYQQRAPAPAPPLPAAAAAKPPAPVVAPAAPAPKAKQQQQYKPPASAFMTESPRESEFTAPSPRAVQKRNAAGDLLPATPPRQPGVQENPAAPPANVASQVAIGKRGAKAPAVVPMTK